jgi:hypothetical protein
VAGEVEFDGDRSSYFLVYTGAGTIFQLDLSRGGFLSGSKVTGDFGTFGPDPGPIFHDPREPGGLEFPIDRGLIPDMLITGLSDQGVVTGVERYGYDYHPEVDMNPSARVATFPGTVTTAA